MPEGGHTSPLHAAGHVEHIELSTERWPMHNVEGTESVTDRGCRHGAEPVAGQQRASSHVAAWRGVVRCAGEWCGVVLGQGNSGSWEALVLWWGSLVPNPDPSPSWQF